MKPHKVCLASMIEGIDEHDLVIAKIMDFPIQC